MANRLLNLSLRQVQKLQKAAVHGQSRIGSREVVGFGFNGQANYVDRTDFPMPAIRFKENTPDIQALRTKEQGDWKKLTLEEKKALYRASFCQTFSEMKAPTGQWKSIVGTTLALISLSLWIYMGMKLYVYKPLPHTLTEENKQAQLQRMIDLRVNPIEGLTSNYDYENNRWK
ncbi:hypothetical protein B566_EDAN016881 [Ephemera danica]|nr:hypothetical protein B566_EDAN016881 [Ephemera danica]